MDRKRKRDGDYGKSGYPMNIKIYREDQLMSEYVRKRDRVCVRCGSRVEFNGEKPVSHQNSHYWSRGNWSTRFDPLNCDTLCFACHRRWGGDYRREYEAFKIKQLGKSAYNKLEVRAHSTVKKDRKLALLMVKALLSEQAATSGPWS